MVVSRRFLSVIGIIIVILYTCTLASTTGCSTTTTTPTPTETTGGIEFVITGADGKPLGGVKIVSQSQPEGQLKVTGITTQSGDRVAFNGLKPGSYSFLLSRADYNPVPVDINVNRGISPVVNIGMVLSETAVPTASPSPSVN